jgi:hypothetical protein
VETLRTNNSILGLARKPENWGLRDRALHRQRLTKRIGRALESSAFACEDPEALAVADMICEGARGENIFIATDMHDADGVCFDGLGSLTSCGSRLDPAYMKACAARARRRAREALDRCKPQAGEHLRFITLTMPRFEADFVQTLDLLDAALVLLKKRRWFKNHVRGAVIGTECTDGEWGDHYHAHAHLLAWSKWIVWQELGDAWSESLESAAEKFGIKLDFGTEHNRAVVRVDLVTAKGRGKGTISLEDAVQETCKYTVKGSDFEKFPQAELPLIERALYRRRMIETYGECNYQKGKAVEKSPYLDENRTTDALAEPLRKVGARLIRAGKRDLWLKHLRSKYAARRAWRKRQLAARYPLAVFRFLNGEVLYGVDVQDEEAFNTAKPHALMF